MAGTIRVLIADDHAVVRLGLRAVLSGEPDLAIVGEAADGIGAVAQAQALRPDVLVLDLAMPGKDGVQVIEELAATAPRIRILVLSVFATDERVFPALRAGADGYLLKESSVAELIRGIPDVAAGKSPLHPDVTRRILQRGTQLAAAPTPKVLTARETEVLALVARGLSNKAIAVQLSLSERTARSHVSDILAKLHLESRTQAALYALRNGIGRLDDEAT